VDIVSYGGMRAASPILRPVASMHGQPSEGSTARGKILRAVHRKSLFPARTYQQRFLYHHGQIYG
jgi:hypothetical protein